MYNKWWCSNIIYSGHIIMLKLPGIMHISSTSTFKNYNQYSMINGGFSNHIDNSYNIANIEGGYANNSDCTIKTYNYNSVIGGGRSNAIDNNIIIMRMFLVLLHIIVIAVYIFITVGPLLVVVILIRLITLKITLRS